MNLFVGVKVCDMCGVIVFDMLYVFIEGEWLLVCMIVDGFEF